MKLDNGKYEIIFENELPIKVLRNGEEWRNIIGDNLIYLLINKIYNLNNGINELINKYECEKDDIRNDYEFMEWEPMYNFFQGVIHELENLQEPSNYIEKYTSEKPVYNPRKEV